MLRLIAIVALAVSLGFAGAAGADPAVSTYVQHGAAYRAVDRTSVATVKTRTVVDSEPNPSTKVMTILDPGTKVTVVGKKGDVAHIKADGVDGTVPLSAPQTGE